jgi:hypothetical protein
MSTTYMSLTLPTVSSTIGPLWATELNSALTTIDGHTHAVGSGQQITPNGLNINTDLSFGNNNATLLRSARFSNQSADLAAAADVGCLFVKGYELYYNDNAGNHVQITNGGSVNGASGTITGLPSGTAGAAYAASTFVFTSATNTAADIDGGSLYLREVAASAKYVKLSSPTSLAADYTVTFPAALPASTKFMTMASSGAVAVAYDVDNSSIEVSSNTIRVKAAGVTNAMLAGSIAGSKIVAGDISATQLGTDSVTTVKILDGNVTPAKRSTAIYNSASTSSSTAVSNSPSVTFNVTLTGRPVMVTIRLTGDNQGPGYLTCTGGQFLGVTKNGGTLFNLLSTGAGTTTYPFSSYTFIDNSGGSGVYTYGLIVSSGTLGPSPGPTGGIVNLVLEAVEL